MPTKCEHPFLYPYWRLIITFAPRLISGDPFKAFRKRFNPFQGVYVYVISASFTAADGDKAIPDLGHSKRLTSIVSPMNFARKGQTTRSSIIVSSAVCSSPAPQQSTIASSISSSRRALLICLGILRKVQNKIPGPSARCIVWPEQLSNHARQCRSIYRFVPGSSNGEPETSDFCFFVSPR